MKNEKEYNKGLPTALELKGMAMIFGGLFVVLGFVAIVAIGLYSLVGALAGIPLWFAAVYVLFLKK